MPTRKTKQEPEREGAGVDLGPVVAAFAQRPELEPEPDDAPAPAPVDDGGLADRIRANRAPKPERTTKVYGRAAAKMPQLNVRLPADLKRRLERYCFETGAQMSEVVEALIADHVPEV